MAVIFVGGTDTGVGKTVVTELLARYLRGRGLKVVTQKWVETGSAKRRSDALPFSFKLAASPHLAARCEGKAIEIKRIKRALKGLSQSADCVVVEGTGGLLVPLKNDTLLIDVVKKLKLPVILVAANRLGAINHTLLSVEALKTRQINIIGIIFNNIAPGKKIILEDNPKIVQKFHKDLLIGTLQKCKNRNKLYEDFMLIGTKFMSCPPPLSRG